MAKYTVRVMDDTLVCEYANVYFSDASGVANKPVTVESTDADGYATITGDGDFITASYATRKFTVPVSAEQFIYIDVSKGGKGTLGEITITASRTKPKINYTPYIILGVCFVVVAGIAIYAVKKLT